MYKMKRTHVIIKRPLIHYVISLGYILAPIVNIMLLIFAARIGLGDILDRLFNGYGTLAGIWLITAPIVGIGLYFVHKISWYIFLAHSSLILIDYILKWVRIPAYYWLSIKGFHQILLFTGNLALVIVIGYIIQKDFRAPYFQVLPRGWRTSRRVPIRHFIQLNGQRSAITDLSITGCFAAEPGRKLKVGEKVSIEFEADTLQVQCGGDVMRKTPDGYGIRFLSLPGRIKRDIRHMINNRFAFRYQVHIPGTWSNGDRGTDCIILDISNTGSYLQADLEGVAEGQQRKLVISFQHRQRHIPGTVIWLNRKELHEKPVGFGIRFARNEKKIVDRIVKQIKQEGASA